MSDSIIKAREMLKGMHMCLCLPEHIPHTVSNDPDGMTPEQLSSLADLIECNAELKKEGEYQEERADELVIHRDDLAKQVNAANEMSYKLTKEVERLNGAKLTEEDAEKIHRAYNILTVEPGERGWLGKDLRRISAKIREGNDV